MENYCPYYLIELKLMIDFKRLSYKAILRQSGRKPCAAASPICWLLKITTHSTHKWIKSFYLPQFQLEMAFSEPDDAITDNTGRAFLHLKKKERYLLNRRSRVHFRFDFYITKFSGVKCL